MQLLFLLLTLILTGCTKTYIVLAPTDKVNKDLILNSHAPAVTVDQVSLIGLNLNQQGNILTVAPGEEISGVVAYVYNCPRCKLGSINQIIIGLANKGAQACIYNGPLVGQGITRFSLKAPKEPGKYYIRFRYAQAWNCADAVKNWWDVNNAPGAKANIGMLVVK